MNPRTSVFDNLADLVEKPLINGYNRWQDEKNYEDIKDYAVLVTKHIEAVGLTFIKMTKFPFGFQCENDQFRVQFFVTKKTYGYRSIFTKGPKPRKDLQNAN